MKKMIIVFSICLSIIISLVETTSAAENTNQGWNNSIVDFSPDIGTLSVTYYPDYVQTVLTCRYSDADAIAIAQYNTQNKYAGLDIKSYSSASNSGNGEKMEAYSVVSSFPGSVIDTEQNFGFPYCNEADVVALDPIEANKPYSVTVYWHDYRTGASADSGEWRSNAELSSQPFWGGDYNTIEYYVLPTISYGCIKGSR